MKRKLALIGYIALILVLCACTSNTSIPATHPTENLETIQAEFPKPPTTAAETAAAEATTSWTMLETIFMPIAEGKVGNSHDEVTSLLTKNGYAFYEGEDGAALQAPDPERIPGNLFGDINEKNEYSSLTYCYVIPEKEIHRMGLYRGIRVEFEGDAARYYIRATRYKKGVEVASAQELWDYITDPEQRYDETPEGHYRAMMEDVLSDRETVGSMDLRDENLCGELTISGYLDVFSDQMGVPVTVTKIAAADMNGDGMKEVLLWMTVDEGIDYGTVVLHYDDRLVFAQNFSYRQLFDVKSDGTFWKSGSPSEDGPARLIFGKDEWHYEDIPAEGFHDKESIHWLDYPCENLSDLLNGT